MKNITKILARSGRNPVVVTAELWHTFDAALSALATEFASVHQTLTWVKRRELLGVDISKESFTRKFLVLARAHPEFMPPMLRPTEIQCD